jgi:hypothetical protein
MRGGRSISLDRVATVGAGTSTVRFNKRIQRFVKRRGRYTVRVIASDAGTQKRTKEVKRRRT